jgi:hypothetical protein
MTLEVRLKQGLALTTAMATKRSATPAVDLRRALVPGGNKSSAAGFSGWNNPESTMKRVALLGAALLAAALASPAAAQEVIYNPGYCAQFYPNANCQNKGPGNPYTGSYQRGWNNGYAAMDRRAWRKHRHVRAY